MRFVVVVLLLVHCSALLAQVPATLSSPHGPDVVMLKELTNLYDPVPFDHKAHAQMAEMWGGCTTCHHRSPMPTTRSAAPRDENARTQANAAYIPACKSCHENAVTEGELLKPNLKGAYHRQCLNCHREWAQANACSACHKQRDPNRKAVASPAPSVDDIVGRMHPPIPEPVEKVFIARFTPAVGKKVLFRHQEHVKRFGLKCVSCHHEDTCATCHAAGATAATVPVNQRPVHPGKTWKDSHGPCVTCHANDGCRTCHYDDQPPPAFAHSITGQILDKDHINLTCGQCHAKLRSKVGVTCGDSSCHAKKTIAFPVQRPGPTVTTRPTTMQIAKAPAATMPTTRAVIKRIRR